MQSFRISSFHSLREIWTENDLGLQDYFVLIFSIAIGIWSIFTWMAMRNRQAAQMRQHQYHDLTNADSEIDTLGEKMHENEGVEQERQRRDFEMVQRQIREQREEARKIRERETRVCEQLRRLIEMDKRQIREQEEEARMMVREKRRIVEEKLREQENEKRQAEARKKNHMNQESEVREKEKKQREHEARKKESDKRKKEAREKEAHKEEEAQRNHIQAQASLNQYNNLWNSLQRHEQNWPYPKPELTETGLLNKTFITDHHRPPRLLALKDTTLISLNTQIFFLKGNIHRLYPFHHYQRTESNPRTDRRYGTHQISSNLSQEKGIGSLASGSIKSSDGNGGRYARC